MNSLTIPALPGKSPSVAGLIAAAAEPNPQGIAIRAPSRSPLTYARLLEQMQRVAASLAAAGIGRGERVATLLPGGPETAVLSLGVMAGATLAPLNPELGTAEVARYLAELRATALIVPAELESPVLGVVEQLGLSLLRLRLDSETAGVFNLEPTHLQADSRNDLAGDDDVALVLHTSGTTSRPKIVPLTQRNLCLSAVSIAASLGLAPGDTCLSVMPLFHVHGLIGALLSSIAAGAGVVCTPGFVVTEFFDWLEEFSPTWYTAVPTMHQAILARAQRHSAVIARRPLRFVRSCSSALPTRVADELAATFGTPVIEAYGMTEAAHQVTTTPLPPGERRAGSVGLASGPAVAIMDESGRMLAPGSIGEIVVRGPSVMAGYENAPEANVSTFASGWLRTGDQGFLDSAGYLFITGRLKELINRAGEKIAPREIDETLLDHPAVAQAIAFGLSHPTLGEEVAAAVVVRAGERVEPKDLRAFVAARLAAFKVPGVIRIVDEIPKGPTGKPQRSQLARVLGLIGTATGDQPRSTTDEAQPTRTELRLAELWSSVLRVDLGEIGRIDNFFHLGGDSVLAAQLVTRLAASLGVNLGLLDVFEQPTLEALSVLVDHRLFENGVASQPEIPRWSGDAPPPPSFGEERTWWFDQIAPDRAVNNRPMAWHFEGPLDVSALRQSLTEIVRRHAPLRTTFPVIAGEVVRSIAQPTAVDLLVIDLRGQPTDLRRSEATRMTAEMTGSPFDLARGPLLRASLLQLDDTEHVLLVVVHHIVFDAWSENVFGRELGALYTQQVGGAPANLPELTIQYADFAAWQRDRLTGESLGTQLDSLRRRLADAPPALELPTDHPRSISPTWGTDEIAFMVSRELLEALEGLRRQAGATLFMTLLGAFDVLLARYSDQPDILVGAPLSGRLAPETEPLIGFFVNTLVLRTDLSDDPTFRDLLDRVRQVCLEAYATQEVPFERLVAVLQTERVAGRNPLVQVLCNLRNVPSGTPSLLGLHTTRWLVRTPSSPFDLSLDMTPGDAGLACVLTYRTELFEHASMQRMAAHFCTILESIGRDAQQPVSSLPLLTQHERTQLLQASSAPRVDYDTERCVHELFEAHATANPEAIALIVGGEQLTYAELDRRANQLARYLRRLGAGPEARIGLFIERSPELIIGLLGILKAGAAYVPLDPIHPAERLGFVLRDAAVSLLVSREHLAARLPMGPVGTVCLDRDGGAIEQESSAAPGVHVHPAALAYVLYTSGSTGAPNGVLVEHGSLSNLIHAVSNVYALGPTDRVLQFASLGFDASAEEIFATLASGATLVLRPSALPDSVARFLRACADQALSVLNVPTAYWHVVVESMAHARLRLPPTVRLVIIGGEAGRGDCLAVWQQHVAAEVRLVNAYGPTEATVTSTLYEVPPARWSATTSASIPIGRPIANTSAYVLDRHLQPLPPGVPGELYLGGRGLARGYVNRPDLTARKFVTDPFCGGDARLYRTGDRVRLLADGNLAFLGRTDEQVKLRGFRIELAEIETTLRSHPAVRDAIVVLAEVQSGERRLVAYVVPHADLPTAPILREFLHSRLPEHMLPSAYVRLDELPLMPNGKVDRRRLPAPEWSRPDSDVVAPRTPLEQIVANIWTELLGLERIGVHDNFFAIGGHSLLAAQLTSRLGAALELDLPLRVVFEAPTVASLATAILDLAADDEELAAPVAV